jgi:hypothetical protein
MVDRFRPSAPRCSGRNRLRSYPLEALAQAAERQTEGEGLRPRTNVRSLLLLFRSQLTGSQSGKLFSPLFLEPLMR